MKYKQAFTHKELLVVTAIIIVLAIIVIFSLVTGRERAYRNSARSELRTILPALHACTQAGGPTSGYVPDSIMVGVEVCPGRDEISMKWPELHNGWSIANYQITNGTIALGTLTYTGYKKGQPNITCSMSTNECK